MDEEWKFIPETEDKYMISNYGRVKSTKRIVTIYGTRQYVKDETIRSQQIDNRGYNRCVVGKHNTIKVHREVAKAFINNPNGYPEINHIDGNKLNNLFSNLEWCSHKQNMEHAGRTGLFHRPSRISDKDVLDIRARYQPFSKLNSSCALAKEYGVDVGYMYRIIVGQKRRLHSIELKGGE